MIRFIELLVGQGWAVSVTNPRGSTGYGAAFAAANKNDLGGGDYRDIMAGVDTVIAKYPHRSQQAGLMGYSYGGEMAGFVEGKTDRFKAIVSGAPVIDQHSEYGTESPGPGTTAGSTASRGSTPPTPGGKARSRTSPTRRRPSCCSRAKPTKPTRSARAGDVSRPAPNGRARRDGAISARRPRPACQRNVRQPQPEPWHGYDARQRIVKFFKTAFGE